MVQVRGTAVGDCRAAHGLQNAVAVALCTLTDTQCERGKDRTREGERTAEVDAGIM